MLAIAILIGLIGALLPVFAAFVTTSVITSGANAATGTVAAAPARNFRRLGSCTTSLTTSSAACEPPKPISISDIACVAF